jgi:outer membrane protein TolC
MKTIFPVLAAFFVIPASAGPVSFPELWQKIRARSPGLQAEQYEAGMAGDARERADLHWLPSISLGGRYFSTNDPGLSLFSKLGQRAVQTQDFAPGSLNEPGFQAFGQLSLQAELPLYEGGMRGAARSATRFWQESREKSVDARELGLHSKAAADFGRILSLGHAKTSALEMKASLSAILKQYSLGSRSNPVGYSGMLGLRALQNRILSILASVESEEGVVMARVSVLAGMDQERWEPANRDLFEFVESFLPEPATPGITLNEEVARLSALGAEEQASMEKARYLPGVGLFGSENWNAGGRGSAFTTTAGVYLRWSLFSPDSWNRMSEAGQRSKREAVLANEASEQARGAFLELSSKTKALDSNLKILRESEELLAEQTRIALRLFRDGAIGALALAEALNRRVDLLLDRLEIESGWIQGRSSLQAYRKIGEKI